MTQVPHITITQKHIDLAFESLGNGCHTIDLCNKVNEIALAEQKQYITAEEARKLGAGNAEWFTDDLEWEVCSKHHLYAAAGKYRAIKQPELVQQWPSPHVNGKPVEPTCQVRNDDTGELKTMTRESAKLLQAETKGVCDWFFPNHTNTNHWESIDFNAEGIYTYKLKANLVKLDGELMTRESAIAKWESKKDACDVYCWTDSCPSWDKNPDACGGDFIGIDEVDGIEYQFRAKQLKQVSWKDVPVGVMTDKGELRRVYQAHVSKQLQATIEAPKSTCPNLIEHYEYECSELELAPAAEQPWIAVPADRSIIGLGNEFQHNGLTCEFDAMRFRITGLEEGWELK